MWAYIFFFIHLEEKNEMDFTNMELYVYNLVSVGKGNFYFKIILFLDHLR